MKKFIRSRIRQILMYFICYIPFSIYPWLLLPSLGCRRINFKKCSISTIYQPAEQNFSRVETRAIRSATKPYNNEKVRYSKKKCLVLARNNSKRTMLY